MRLLLGVAALLLAAPVIAQPVYGPKPTTQPEHGDTPPVDYADARAWMCRPGVDDGTCSTNLDALAVDTDVRAACRRACTVHDNSASNDQVEAHPHNLQVVARVRQTLSLSSAFQTCIVDRSVRVCKGLLSAHAR